ncbi:MAG TPA: hypothetical protein VF803_03095 [Candidatus Paceibacterota bacterium]
MWQDYIVAIVQWVFFIALIPTIRHATHKPPVSSSLLTAVMTMILSATFATIPLWNSTLSSFACGAAWFVIAYQRYKLDKSTAQV